MSKQVWKRNLGLPHVHGEKRAAREDLRLETPNFINLESEWGSRWHVRPWPSAVAGGPVGDKVRGCRTQSASGAPHAATARPGGCPVPGSCSSPEALMCLG